MPAGRRYGWPVVPESPASDAPAPEVAAPDPTRPAAPHAQTGDLVADRYELEGLIASGGMAEVWRARDRVLGRPVAVKLLHRHLATDHTFTQRFRAEAVAAARLHHPSIVAIFDTCADGTHEAIVMELVQGRTMREYLDERGRLDPSEVVQIGVDVADALHAAHRAGIVHRDIKPANILLCDDARVMVTDFGIAKVRDDTDLTNAGTMLGTVKYLAPEQVESAAVDARTDIYALGVVLYEALAGGPPFAADTAAATALARLHRPPRPIHDLRPDVPRSLDEVVTKALQRDPDRRFGSASEMRAALLVPSDRADAKPTRDDTVVAHDATTWGPPPPRPPQAPLAPTGPVATAPTAAEPSPRPARRYDWVLPSLLVLLVGASIGLAIALVARTQANDQPSNGAAGSTSPATIAAIASFDPFGTGGEHDYELRNAIDGNPSTAWRSEGYSTRDFGGIKSGVGLVLALEGPADLQGLTASSPTSGWSAAVYVADAPADTLEGWGEPVVAREGIDGDAAFDIDGASGRAVLLWFTQLGEPPYVMQIDELALRT
jgi:serine/threonine-protein kinase